jgi:hypothetical protein
MDPQVGIANDGTATLLYARQALGHPHRLIARRRLVGTGWTAPRTVAREGYEEQLAVDRYGDAMVAYRSVSQAVKATYRPVGRPWQPPQRLSSKALEGPAFSLAMNRPGRAVVALGWYGGRVVVVRRPRQGPWAPPARVQAPGKPLGFITVALNGSGDTLLAWGYHAVYSRYRTDHRAWGRRFTVSPDAGVNVLEGLQSAIAAHGDAAVMWTQEELPLKVRVRSVS